MCKDFTIKARCPVEIEEQFSILRSAITKCLIQRQDRTYSHTVAKPVANNSKANELKEYKELLDMGVISQEEFDAKKKQLLGL